MDTHGGGGQLFLNCRCRVGDPSKVPWAAMLHRGPPRRAPDLLITKGAVPEVKSGPRAAVERIPHKPWLRDGETAPDSAPAHRPAWKSEEQL